MGSFFLFAGSFFLPVGSFFLPAGLFFLRAGHFSLPVGSNLFLRTRNNSDQWAEPTEWIIHNNNCSFLQGSIVRMVFYSYPIVKWNASSVDPRTTYCEFVYSSWVAWNIFHSKCHLCSYFVVFIENIFWAVVRSATRIIINWRIILCGNMLTQLIIRHTDRQAHERVFFSGQLFAVLSPSVVRTGCIHSIRSPSRRSLFSDAHTHTARPYTIHACTFMHHTR